MSEAIQPIQAIKQGDHQTKDWTPAKVIYTGLMALALLSHIWLMMIGAGIDNIPTYIWILRLLPVPFAIYLGKLWKDRGFQILSLYFLLFFFRCFISNPGSTFSVEMAESILSALWLFAACYGLARVLTRKQLERFLLTNSIIWVVIITILCCLGIYVTWTEQTIPLLGNGAIQVISAWGYIRLELVYVSTVSGVVMSITVLIGMILILNIQKYILKITMIIMLIPIIISMALTDSRTAFIGTATGLAIIVFCYVQYFYRKRQMPDKRSNKKAWFFGTVAMIATFAFVVFAILHISPIFNRLRTQGLIPRAVAEETRKTVVYSRGFEGSNVLTGRMDIWSSIIEHIKQEKSILLIGKSKIVPHAIYGQHYGGEYGHSHCIYLQILVESGIPGIILILLFIGCFIKTAIQILARKDYPLWIHLLPAIPISLWVVDLVECFTWLRSSICPMTTVLFITTGILSNQNGTTKTHRY